MPQPWELYDRVAEEYVSRFMRREMLDEDRWFLDQFADLSEAKRKKAVLDIGCGPGVHAAYWTGRGYTYVGVDLAIKMLRLAAQRHEDDAIYLCASATQLPIRSASFATITAIGSLVHLSVKDFRAALCEIGRCLMPGGEVLLLLQAGEGVVSEEFPLDRKFNILTLLLTESAIEAYGRGAGLCLVCTMRRTATKEELKFDKLIAILQKSMTI